MASGLEEELEKELRELQRLARRNYTAVYALSLIAILASFLAGLSVALEWFGKSILAVLSATPALVLITSDRLSLEARARWYWTKFYDLRGVLSALAHEELDAVSASRRRTQIDQDYESQWPGFGTPPK